MKESYLKPVGIRIKKGSKRGWSNAGCEWIYAPRPNNKPFKGFHTTKKQFTIKKKNWTGRNFKRMRR